MGNRGRVLVACLGLGLAAWAAAAEAVRFDFESAAPDGWRVVEGDLGRFLCNRPVWYDGKPFGKQGAGFLSTIETPAGPWDDGLTGVAESPVFVPSAPGMSFLVGGGSPDSVYVTLCGVDGRELARATGHNSHVMRRVDWQVPAATGTPVFLRLVDRHTAGYGWLTFDDFQAVGRVDTDATRARFADVDRKVRGQAVDRLRSRVDLDALRRLLADLTRTWGDGFPRGAEFGARLERHAGELAALGPAAPGESGGVGAEATVAKLEAIVAFQREVALAHPLLVSHPILFVVREQYLPDHHNTETIFQTGEPNAGQYRPGGALKLLDPTSGRTSVLFDPGPEGLVRDPEVHFDGRRVVFALRRARDENYSIYELAVDPANGWAAVPGSLRRLTTEPDATDIDPLYLPDGKIVFSSTRQPKYCHCNMHIMANLYRMDGDGANIHQIGGSTLFEGHASLLPDGRILYYRWEYVDRNFGDAQGLWTAHPDGTNQAVYWGNNTVSPAAVFDGRAIPGTDAVVCVFGACHDRPWGALAVLDRGRGIDRRDAVARLWPASARERISIDGGDLPEPFMCDHFIPLRSRYEDPFPLRDPRTGRGGTYYLVSRSLDPVPADRPVRSQHDANGLVMAIFLVDTFGNEILLHTEKPGCFDPMPLAPHPRPPALPERRDDASPTGAMYVSDVYRGAHMQGVRRGEVAGLRVVESVEKRFWTGPLWVCAQFAKPHNGRLTRGETLNRPAISWAGFEVKRILGTVPVAPDGSAYVQVPADRFVYFQLLDRDGMLISTMRSGTQVKPGETLGCVGCHEPRLSAPPGAPAPAALRRPPAALNGWYGPARAFNYVAEVQPVWDRHCVRCHDFGARAGGKLVLAGDKELVFNASYVELFRNWGTDDAWLNTVGLGLAPVPAARALGSPRSRLVEHLRRGHNDVRLSAEELDRIVTWIDIGGPYYPDYACAHPDNVAGRAPLTIPQARRLEELTGVRGLDAQGNPGYGTHRLWFTFGRPELSPCLAKLDKGGDAYREALAIIREGQADLQRHPEADMPGFTCCDEHRVRADKYRRLGERERARRDALCANRRVYDPGVAP